MIDRRCAWANPANPRYLDYHDREWGVPSYDDAHLFEMLILEGCQAGLSWETILNKRENYRRAYDGFDPERMARWSDARLEELRGDAGIVRNRLKIKAARTNAQAYLRVVDDYASFAGYIWKFVDGSPVQNRFRSLAEIPATTETSDAMSKELKKLGFTFVGSTICYAYMQSVGMVNDHVVDCFRHRECAASAE